MTPEPESKSESGSLPRRDGGTGIFRHFSWKRTPREQPPLSDAEYRKLFQLDPRRLLLRRLLLIVGTLVLVTCLALAFAPSVVLPFLDFTLPITYEGREFTMNLTAPFFLLVSLLGLYCVARGALLGLDGLWENKFHVPHHTRPRETPVKEDAVLKTRSFASSRLAAAAILILLAVVNATIFGVDLTSENEIGSWLVLGGPTLFYPTSVPPLVVAVGLVGYVVVSSGVVVVKRTPHLVIVERYRGLGLVPWATEIPRDRIRAALVTNAKSGARFLWCFFFLLHGGYLAVQGSALVFDPNAFGMAFVGGTMYWIQALVDFAVLALLLLRHQTLVQVHTDEKRYEMQFAPPAATPVITRQLERVLGVPVASSKRDAMHQKREAGSEVGREAGSEAGKEATAEESLAAPRTAPGTRLRAFHRVGFGACLVILAVLTRVFSFYAGQALRFAFLITGTILLVKGFKQDFSSPRDPFQVERVPASAPASDPPGPQSNTINVLVRRRWAWYKETHFFPAVPADHVTRRLWIPAFDVFDYLVLGGLALLLGMDLAVVLVLVPPAASSYGAFVVGHVIGFVLLMGTTFGVLCHPREMLLVKTPGGLVQVLVPPSSQGSPSASRGRTLGRLVRAGIRKWKLAWRDHRPLLLQRLGLALALALIGAAVVVGLVVVPG